MKKRSKLVVILGTIVLVSAFLVACGSTQSQQNRSQERAPQPSPPTGQVTQPPVVVSHKVGEVVNVADGHTLQITITRTWQVNKVDAFEGSWTDDMGPDDYYLIVDLTVKNVSQTPLPISSYSFVLRDEQGNKMEMYPLYVAKIVQGPPSGNILPGMQQKGDLTFWAKHSIKTYDLIYQPDMPETPPILWKIS